MKESVQKKIARNIKRFDLYSLIKLLDSLGYSRKDIYFESNSNLTSHDSLCESITFSEEPPKITIALNMGLLSSSSSLPSFFRKYMESEEMNGEAFAQYLGFFNHHLTNTLLHLILIENNESFFTNWRETQFHCLSLLGFESISTLWFLMKMCFPDLVVAVEKNPQVMSLHTSSLILGRDGLGSNPLGKKFKQILSSFKVTFTTEEELSELGIPWPIEINKRLIELIFPLLRKTDVHLSIVLVIKHKYDSMSLGFKAYLGFDRLGKSPHPFQLLLFYGLIKDLKRNAYLAK